MTLDTIFEKDLLEEIENKSKKKIYKSGEIIIKTGDVVKDMPIISSGTVKVARTDEAGKEILLYYVSSAESCAMTFTCCMQHQKSEINAVAEEETEILFVPVELMDEWLVKYPSWKSFVMQTIRNRFNELLKTIDQIAFQKLDERLVNYLRTKSQATGSALVNLSHEQIASELATSRVVISRLLKKLENDKKLLLYRNQIKLLSGF